jgi:hypothetical protein
MVISEERYEPWFGLVFWNVSRVEECGLTVPPYLELCHCAGCASKVEAPLVVRLAATKCVMTSPVPRCSGVTVESRRGRQRWHAVGRDSRGGAAESGWDPRRTEAAAMEEVGRWDVSKVRNGGVSR